jgi:hypothetical protein
MRPHNALNGTAASSEVLVVSHSPQSHHCRDVSADRHVGDPRRRTGQHELREQNLPERADLVAGLQNCGPGCHAPWRTRPASRRPRARPQKCETSVNHEPAYFIAKGITGRRQVCGQRGRRGRGAGGHAFEWYREAIEDEAPASTRRTALRPGPPRQLPGGGSPVTSSRNRGSAKSRKSTI